MATAKKDKKSKTLKKQVYLVDDHPIVRQGLIKLIEQEEGLEVCGESGTVMEALEDLKKLGPDVILVDISLEDSNGLELIKLVDDLGMQPLVPGHRLDDGLNAREFLVVHVHTIEPSSAHARDHPEQVLERAHVGGKAPDVGGRSLSRDDSATAIGTGHHIDES